MKNFSGRPDFFDLSIKIFLESEHPENRENPHLKKKNSTISTELTIFFSEFFALNIF